MTRTFSYPTPVTATGGAPTFPGMLKSSSITPLMEMPGWQMVVRADASTTLSQGVIYYIPMFVFETTTYTEIDIDSGGGTGTAVDTRIFNWNDGTPGTQKASLGNLGNVLGVNTLAINVTLTAGFYFMAFRPTDGTAVWQIINWAFPATPPVNGLNTNIFTDLTNVLNGVAMTVTAAYSSPGPTPTGLTNNIPVFLMKRG